MNKNIIRKVLLSGLMSFLLVSRAAYAEIAFSDSAAYDEYLRLRALKEQNPTAYQQIIRDKKKKLSEQIAALESNPSAYQRFQEKNQQVRLQRLQHLRNQNPSAYQDFVQKRVEHVRKMKREQPEKYASWVKKHPRVEQKLDALKETRRTENPESFLSDNSSQVKKQNILKPSEEMPLSKKEFFERRDDSNLQEKLIHQNGERSPIATGEGPRRLLDPHSGDNRINRDKRARETELRSKSAMLPQRADEESFGFQRKRPMDAQPGGPGTIRPVERGTQRREIQGQKSPQGGTERRPPVKRRRS